MPAAPTTSTPVQLTRSIYEFDSTQLRPTNIYTNPSYESSSFYIKMDVSYCGDWIASGSKDSQIYLWQVDNPQRQLVLDGHSAEVSCVAFSKFDYKIASCSDDMTVRIWEPLEDVSGHNPTLGIARKVEVADADDSDARGLLAVPEPFLEDTPRTEKPCEPVFHQATLDGQLLSSRKGKENRMLGGISSATDIPDDLESQVLSPQTTPQPCSSGSILTSPLQSSSSATRPQPSLGPSKKRATESPHVSSSRPSKKSLSILDFFHRQS
ncbi:hypothetical protein HDU91_003551 [Kappamyces sp. JEL0680]|nr:hypothetical protein HDU91_003551 [Kappamyces sp. JEL0680]